MAEFAGKLYIFVDTRRERQGALSETEPVDVFDLRYPGEMLWYLNGWAIGNNARGSYCARTSPARMRSFGTFAEAKDFVRKKSKGRPLENFHLVYDRNGEKSIVSSLEEILQLDGRLAADHRVQPDVAAYPQLAQLAEKVGRIVATNALELLRILADEGEAAAKARFSAATYERLWRVLQEAALLEASSSH